MSTQLTNGAGEEGEKVNTNIVTLTRFLTEEQVKHKEATGDFTYVILYPLFLPLTTQCSQPANNQPPKASSAMPSNSPSSPSPTTSAAPRW